MRLSDMVAMALKNLWKRKLRTFLTILGVVIGTASIVVMVSIGIGMNESFRRQVEEWGSLSVINVSLSGGGGDVYYSSGGMEMIANNGGTKSKGEVVLNNAAIEEIKQIPGVVGATPVVREYFILVCGKLMADATIVGIDPESMEMMGYQVADGRLLTGDDSDALVLGGSIPTQFYNPKLSWEMRYNSEPTEVDVLNEKLLLTYDWRYGTRDADKKIKPTKVKAVGLLSDSGSDSYSVFMPIKALEKIKDEQQKYQDSASGGGSNSQKKKKGYYDQAMVKVGDMNQVKEVQEKLKEMGYEAYSLTDELETMKETTKMLRMVLGAIGGVSLVVAAIGITNTMIMSIYERTREIGVMKVIGASLPDIQKLFLTEAAFIGFGGGLFGILVSFGMSKVVNLVASQQDSTMLSYIPLWLFGGSLLFATFIGVLSGYLPARRAMKLSALSAIKTE